MGENMCQKWFTDLVSQINHFYVSHINGLWAIRVKHKIDSSYVSHLIWIAWCYIAYFTYLSEDFLTMRQISYFDKLIFF